MGATHTCGDAAGPRGRAVLLWLMCSKGGLRAARGWRAAKGAEVAEPRLSLTAPSLSPSPIAVYLALSSCSVLIWRPAARPRVKSDAVLRNCGIAELRDCHCLQHGSTSSSCRPELPSRGTRATCTRSLPSALGCRGANKGIWKDLDSPWTSLSWHKHSGGSLNSAVLEPCSGSISPRTETGQGGSDEVALRVIVSS